MDTPASTAPHIVQPGTYPSVAAIMLMVALSILIFGVGYYLRRQQKLSGSRSTMLWALASVLPLLIAFYWGYAWLV